MQATNQYKKQSNFEREKLMALMAEQLVHMYGSSNLGPAKFNPLCPPYNVEACNEIAVPISAS